MAQKMWLKVWLNARLEYEAIKPWIDFLAFLRVTSLPDDPKSLRHMLSNFR